MQDFYILKLVFRQQGKKNIPTCVQEDCQLNKLVAKGIFKELILIVIVLTGKLSRS